jgi:hypothetical protein
MRTTHAFGVPLAIFVIYLGLAYFFSPNYDTSTLNSFLIENVKSITWACVGLFLAVTFDFLRRATHVDNYIQVNSNFFLWTITISLLMQLLLAACQGILLMNGAPRLIVLLGGYETYVLLFIIGTTAVNAIGYAIGVDLIS